ncbi:MAG: hypothetical protein WC953_07405 [Pseudomonas sp.]
MRRFIFFILVLVSIQAYADDYYWQGSSGQYSGTGPSPSAAAQDYFDNFVDGTVTSCALAGSQNNQPYFRCDGTYTLVYEGKEYPRNTFFYAYRRGSSCPPGATYNAQTGECESDDECADLEGISRNFSRSGNAPDAFMFIGGGSYAYDQNICVSGCSATVGDAKCTVKLDGPYTCVGSSTFTGTKCTGGPGGADPDTSSDETDETEPLPPEQTNEFKPCTYTTGPGGVQTCVSENNQSNDGSCGTFNGVMVCNPAPEKTDQKIETTIQTTTKPDGSTETTKTDTLTVNNCVGANACTTTTTTNTTTTTTSPDGQTQSVTGECTGPNCPDKNGHPDGFGEGFGGCVGSNCGDGEDEKPFQGGELGEVKSFGESIDDFMTRAGDAPIIQSIGAIAFPTGGTCGFGAASTAIGTISLDGMCENSHWLDPLYPIFLAVWCLAAVRKFMEA